MSRQYLPNIVELLIRAETKTLALAFDTALKKSSGKYSTKKLSEPPPGLNHPYGLGPSNSRGPRGPIPYGNPAIINKQTGQFFSSWKFNLPQHVADHIVSELYNDAPYADVLHTGMIGKRGFIPRPIIEAVKKRIEKERVYNIFRELQTLR